MKITLQTKFNHDTFYSFIRKDQEMKIYYGGELMMCVDLSDSRELKQTIICFLKIGVSVHWLSRTFGIARQTVTEWYSIYKKDGMEALFNLKRGPKKITDEIQAYIIAKFKDLALCRNYKNIICEKIEEHFKITIHWRSVSEVLVKNGIDLSANRYNRKKQPVDSSTDSKTHTCSHAGLFFIYPYLVKLGIEKLFSNVRQLFANAQYSVMEYIYGLLFLLASNKIKVEENIKMYQNKKLEMVVGMNGLPSLRSYRSYIPRIIEGIDINEFEYMIARNYYKEHATCRELYIDGHFMPYHGKYETFKGYNPIRRFAQKGRVGYFINSHEGRPFFYILSDGYKDFREYLIEIAQNIDEITQDKRRGDLILVFDRGGWGSDFCDELGSEITFVCWRRGKPEVPCDVSWERVDIEKKTNDYGIYEKETLETCEVAEKAGKGKRIKRYIFIKRGEKISLAFSNDSKRSLVELVRILTKRWGLQENVFKGLKEIGIDKISSYECSNYPEDWLLEESEYREVLNPQKRIIDERISGFKAEIKNFSEELGKLSRNGKKNNGKRIEYLRSELEKKEEMIRQLRVEREQVPEKVNITEIIEAEDIVRLNSEKKKFFDLMKVLSYNVQQDIVDTISPVYDNERDVNMFVREILDQEGTIEMAGDSITISFRLFNSGKKNEVLKLLIENANNMNIRHPILNVAMRFRCG
jgi:transposase/archaellum component FlaC